MPKKTGPHKEKGSFVKGIIKIGALCLAAYVAFSMISSQIELAEKRKTLELLKKDKENIMISNAEKQELIKKSSENEFIERIAREYYNFAYPNENVFIDSSGS